jgi:anti-sigma B factor antagonist
VGCFTTMARKGGKMKLLNLTPKINDILQVTQLITVFDVFDNEADALKSFGS